MKVKLIQITQNPIDVMWTAARTCYSAKSPIDMWEDRYFVEGELTEDEAIDNYNFKQEKMWNLVKKVLDSGHQSIAEHVYFTFVIEGISRACSHQLVRHRAGIVFSQQSQRYVEIKENIEDIDTLLMHLDAGKETLMSIASKYFVDVNESNYLVYIRNLLDYLEAIQKGYKPEDARMFLPNATKTNLVISMNLRELIHICNLRLCTRSQLEIRKMVKEMTLAIIEKEQRLQEYLQPNCERLGYCPEGKGCGRKPSLEEKLKHNK